MDLVSYLTRLPRACKTVFYANPGNAGDAMIASATYQLFRRLDLPFEVYDEVRPTDLEGATFIYGGGGNLTEFYVHARDLIASVYPSVERLVILPHTVTGHEDLLSTLGRNVDIFVRERCSFEHVRRHARRANVHLSHDMALGLDVEQLMSSVDAISIPVAFAKKLYLRLLNDDRERSIPSPRRMLSAGASAMRHSARLALNGTACCEVSCLRTDRESTGASRPSHNFDASDVFGFGTHNEQQAAYGTFRLLDFLGRFERITTDRLHIAIGGALLGKRVNLRANAYFKNSAVFRHSLADRFPNVHWQG